VPLDTSESVRLILWFREKRRPTFQSINAGHPAYRALQSTQMNMNQSILVLLRLIAAFFVATAPALAQSGAVASPVGRAVAPGVFEVGRISHPRITESSGVAASRQYPGVYWTHNDGGGGKKQVLYAISRDGQLVAALTIGEVLLADWEDIAIDDNQHLFIADTGNNDGNRTEVAVHQLDEPDPKAGLRYLAPKRTWRLRFPGQPFDAEGLFVWQDSGYLISKVTNDARAQIFRFPLSDQKEPFTLELVATTKIKSPVTGADISPNGRLLGIVAKSGAFVYPIDGDVSRADKGKPRQVKFRHDSVEACTFVPEGLLVTAESREIFLFTGEAFRWK
jgi:hypothetical protein